MILLETDRFKGYYATKGIQFPYTSTVMESNNQLIFEDIQKGKTIEIIAGWSVP
jgi:hypothetical protein